MRDGYSQHPTCNLFAPWPWPSTADFYESAFERLARELTEMFPARTMNDLHRAKFIKALPPFLTKLCLDPAVVVGRAEIVYFENIIDSLFEYKRRFEEAIGPKVASTVAQQIIHELLDYALSQRGMILVEGTYRIGKSYAAQSWALQHLGICRYVQLSSSTDDTAFYRDIARALGVACGLKMKAAELRHRIEEVARTQHLFLLFDESQWLLPQSINLKASPNRVNWLMTALCNNGVPVALIASRDFSRMMAHVEKKCPIWGSEQFWGRIKARRTLPDNLAEADLFAIAALLVPDADEPTRMLLVGHALKSDGYVAALEAAATRAKFFAAKESRPVGFEDVQRVMIECGTDKPTAQPVEPTDALANILSPQFRQAAAPSPLAARGLPASQRQPLGPLVGTTDFTGTRHPG